MNVTPHDPIGATVTGLDLAALDPGAVQRLRGLLAEHGMLAFAGQRIDDDGFLAFLRGFGPLAFTRGEASLPGYPDLNPVSNVGRSTPPKSAWHVDTSYVAEPPAYTALRAVTIPQRGGETLFSNQYRALETLPAERREDIAQRTMTHVVTGVALRDGDQSAAEHPLVRPHPRTGRPALYLTTPSRCRAVSGLDEDAGAALVADLLAHSTRVQNVHRHAWSPGDVVVWDNACVLHRAEHSGVVGDRVMHRGMVAGYGG